LKYRGDSFVQRFDANSYLYLSKALDYFDLAEDGDIAAVLKNVRSRVLIITFTSDWLYPSYQSKQMVKALKANDVEVSFVELDTDYGHDSFLVEIESQSKLVRHFLDNVGKDVFHERR
jgi:homoserine O-acetyltransferase/O-succinyltransferase